MPGIAGIISKKKSSTENVADLNLMIERMMHEPFYSSGKYVNEKLGVYTGWVSHAGSFSDNMPVYNEKKDVVLIFTGEDFTSKDSVDNIKRKGHQFDENSASYLVHLYENDEEGFLKTLNGWFSGLLVDLRRDRVILFNDRYGLQRIYFYENEDVFIFSSEAKSLLSICPAIREIDLISLGEFLAFGSVLCDRTLFKDVFLMPSGSQWIFSNNSLKKDCYFHLNDWESQPVLEMETFNEELIKTFKVIVPRYFYSKRQIAMSLTGGLDTRMIMAYSNHRHGELNCYTYGGMFRDCYDLKIARKVAETCGQKHSVCALGSDFLSDFPSLAEKTIYITDGCLDVCGSHEIYLSKLAREIAPIRMTGNYGSEVMRSINWIRQNRLHKQLLNPDFQLYIEAAINSFSTMNEEHPLTYAVSKLIPRHLYGRLAAAQSQLTLRTPFMDNDLVKLMYQAPIDVRASKEISLRLIRNGNPELGVISTDRGVGGNANYISGKLTRLYRELLFKSEYLFNEGMPDWLAKINHAMRSLHVEKIMLGHHKIEHYRLWFGTNLAEYSRDMILDARTLSRPYWNRRFLESLVYDHANGKRNNIQDINKVLSVELIHRTLIEYN